MGDKKSRSLGRIDGRLFRIAGRIVQASEAEDSNDPVGRLTQWASWAEDVHSFHWVRAWCTSSILFDLRMTDNRGRGSPDRKKSILKRTDGAAANSPRPRPDLESSDQEMEKLIVDSGASDAGSGTEALSPAGRRLRPPVASPKRKPAYSTAYSAVRTPAQGPQTRPERTVAVGNLHRRNPSVSVSAFKAATSHPLGIESDHGRDRSNSEKTLGVAVDDWPFVDSSPVEEVTSVSLPINKAT